MLRVLFFARVREQLGCAALELDFPVAGTDLDALQEELCRSGGERWREVLGEENMLRAVNHTVIEGNAPLSDGDEIAYFPPVTGG